MKPCSYRHLSTLYPGSVDHSISLLQQALAVQVQHFVLPRGVATNVLFSENASSASLSFKEARTRRTMLLRIYTCRVPRIALEANSRTLIDCSDHLDNFHLPQRKCLHPDPFSAWDSAGLPQVNRVRMGHI